MALGYVLARHPDAFPSAAARLAATFDLALLGYWLTPQAPPWWASEYGGRLDGRVKRVVTRVARDLRDQPLEQGDIDSNNPWAAMPSDHFASALQTALVLFEVSPRLGALAGGYALALGAALVYLGEHYVIDLLAGTGLALGVRAAAPRLAPAGRALERAWRGVEPG